MIQVAGRTYRIVEIGPATYRAVRIADETELGVFQSGPPLRLWDCRDFVDELGQVARSAVRAGKTRWARVVGARVELERRGSALPPARSSSG